MDSKTTGFLSALALSATLIGCERRADRAESGVRAAAVSLMSATAPPAPSEPPAASAARATDVAPAAPSAAATSRSTRHADARLSVRRLVVATSVDRAQREPVGAAERFERGHFERLYAFVELDNGARRASEIFVTFEPERGTSRGQVSLDVGAAPRWRTWAYTRAADVPGKWAAVVRDEQGQVLARTPFTIEG